MAYESKQLQALADGTRRRIFEGLAAQPMAVVDIAARLTVSRPAVSQHLKVLKDAGLVGLRKVGTRHLYQVDPSGIEAMRFYLDQLWDQALASFKAFAEAEDPEQTAAGEKSPGT